MGHLSGRVGLVVLAVTLGLMVVACGTVGSGDLVTESRSVGSFDGLDVSEGINVNLLVDPGAVPSVSVTFDDNLLSKLVTEVRGGTLVIEFDGSVSILGSGRFVDVTVDSLDSIEVSGGADLNGFGTATDYRLSASGGADVDLAGLDAANVEVDISGGANARVFASVSVVGEASGGAALTVSGDPDQSGIDTSGGANVDFEN
ncbi:MAG TPA: DUF2807 domain-containing protein [Acidimicrobiia bacterium]|nr:DUF2807 domain-containing protein [Acidimicrobiia bacterium]